MKYIYEKDICDKCGNDKVEKKSIFGDDKRPNLYVIKCKNCDNVWTIKV